MIDKSKKLPYSGQSVLAFFGLNNVKEVKAFDELDNDLIIDSLSGHCVKTFAQYELNKLPELVNELKSNPQSSYITCFNDAIRENNVPQYISVLFKNKNNENERIVREVVGSRILHSLGYPTVYNFALETPGITGLLASVDFISDNQTFMSLSEFGFEELFEKNAIKVQKHKLKNFYKDEFGRTDKIVEYEINELICDYFINYILRVGLLDDGDYKPKNGGILIDWQKGKISFAPHFDMEYIYDKLPVQNKNIVLGNDSNNPDIFQIMRDLKKMRIPHLEEKINDMFGRVEKVMNINSSTGKTMVAEAVESAGFDGQTTKDFTNKAEIRMAEMLDFAKTNRLYKEEKGM